ncbi:hypothetical protein [Natrinema gari]|uniref:Uncharacterized protein n=1 Tax=Natrinema gari JCM 14663 TaxID=1230459 RepID=L9YYX7_9EURY|nr:hypothetical protein [Natrinema gari]ELY79440.1 hypothetical protein C486_10574 [Natrinema gari JCM 14663]
MDAVITGQNEERVGINLRDNNGAEHVLEIEFTGDIRYHKCEQYPDKPENRTPEENEYNEQARKFARYYVYVEQGYDTVPPTEHPERINAVRLAIQDLSDDRFDDLFGDLYSQLQSYYDYDADRPIPIPPLAADSDSVLYRQNVYLGIDPLETDIAAEAEDMAPVYGLELSEISIKEQALDTLSPSAIANWKSFAVDFADEVDEEEIDLVDGTYIDAVSTLYTSYLDNGGEQHTAEPDTDPFERDPDTLIELPPIDPGPLAEFREYLDHHLKCQIRDCFVRMGIEPPEQFRVLGNGRLEATAAYKLLDMYPKYYDPEEQQLLG